MSESAVILSINNPLSDKKTLVYKLNNIPGFNEIIKPDVKELSSPLKLNKIFCESSNKQFYKIIRYDKKSLSSDQIASGGFLRSIILNKDDKVVSFSPQKSIQWTNFLTNNPEKTDIIIAEEFVEGTMINVFWDKNIGVTGSWEISTRSNVGADISFYHSIDPSKKNITFRDMFMEALNLSGLDLNSLSIYFSYSFVLQHPKNRIVVPFKRPQLYLVSVYEIIHTEGEIVNVMPIDMDVIKAQTNIWGQTTIQFPKIYNDLNNYFDIAHKYASMDTSYDIVGVIVKNLVTGERTKLRNPVYENVRHLRGNQPKLMYQYLCLRKEGKVKEYLTYYKEDVREFSLFRNIIHIYTKSLFQNYICCYMKKEKPLKEYPENYRTHMYNIHQIYVNELKEKKAFVTLPIIIEYVNNVHPSLLMHALNYNMKKRSVDILKSDNDLESILLDYEEQGQQE
jgi:hypothetical protein